MHRLPHVLVWVPTLLTWACKLRLHCQLQQRVQGAYLAGFAESSRRYPGNQEYLRCARAQSSLTKLSRFPRWLRTACPRLCFPEMPNLKIQSSRNGWDYADHCSCFLFLLHPEDGAPPALGVGVNTIYRRRYNFLELL